MSTNLQTLESSSDAPAACACSGLCLELPDEVREELAALAAVHTGGDVNRMAVLLLVRQLRPIEFEMAGAA